ncbi:hypothetical protein MEA186_25197 [Mesorhizobium amorphae CCNWGS0123]|uniref:Uncharacterized protein n=1 Tax=Mesorhizobium amorphae CCNWGS0123 TaxID=1082933 RepID=G6YGD1_9HYPH|nr:hypothetical protein MEA186_25197 [Mesorhizobium amorphae CCNWGS0123]
MAFALEIMSSLLKTFSFRALAPLCDMGPFELRAISKGHGNATVD